MEHYINETTVMKFYIEQLDNNQIIFLQNHESKKTNIRSLIVALMDEQTMNGKINIACKLWKALFDASMSFISPDRRGYDKLFQYFDTYVEFEELIFASDSFYRDHTLHCIWVYFLGEYLKRNQHFRSLFMESDNQINVLKATVDIFERTKILPDEDFLRIRSNVEICEKLLSNDEAGRCVAALTHDLGYPLKKIEKINKSIKKVLPYFSIKNFDDFSFEYTNVQQGFISQFIDFLSRSFSMDLALSASYDNEPLEILNSLFNCTAEGAVRGVNFDAVDRLTERELNLLANSCKFQVSYAAPVAGKLSFENDFEEYKHGIMSAFLLCKNLHAFQNIDYNALQDSMSGRTKYPSETVLTLQQILTAISNHTCDTYTIDTLDTESFLTFVDELEEFSRISRASQNREYVEEFCDTALYMADGWLNIHFEFNNTQLDNLNPEISFKGRCKRFLQLFNIPKLNPGLKLRVTCIGNLPTNQNTYVLEIARNHADIRINGESVNIPQYLKSSEFYTTEEYAKL